MAAQSRWESTLGTLKIHTNSYLSSPSAWLHLDPKPCQNRLPKTRMPHRSDCCLHFCGSSLRLITRKSIRHASMMSDGYQRSIFWDTLSTTSRDQKGQYAKGVMRIQTAKSSASPFTSKENCLFKIPPTSTMPKAVLRLPRKCLRFTILSFAIFGLAILHFTILLETCPSLWKDLPS